MYKEILENKNKDREPLFLKALGLLFLLIFIVGFSNLLHNRYGIPYTGYIAFGLYIIVGIFVYRNTLRKFQYSFDKNLLLFESIVGKRFKELVKVNLNKTLYFCPLTDEKKDDRTSYKSSYMVYDRKHEDNYVLAIDDGNKIRRIIFRPSRKLIDLIEGAVI